MATIVTPTKPWSPIISPKQAQIITHPPGKYYRLITGPRLSSKTWGCLHADCWHLWNTPGAYGMMLGKTVDQNLNAGAWQHLIERTIPEWIKGGFGFEYVTEPRMEPVTHRWYFETTNREMAQRGEGKPSRFVLDSLSDERMVEDKFKGKEFSLIHWTELSNFKRRSSFDAIQECFRGRTDDKYLLLCETNPSDEGEDSWIWQLWYWFRTVDFENIDKDTEEKLQLVDMVGRDRADMIASLRALQKKLDVVEVGIDDNPYLSEEKKAQQRAKYAHNKDLFDRYYRGIWKKASGDGIFMEVWKPSIHIVGQRPAMFKPEPDEFMVPEESCIELGRGWDLGSVNNAVGFIEKVPLEFDNKIIKPGFKIIDELVILGETVKLEDIVSELLEKQAFWEKLVGRKLLWHDWSDNSSFGKYSMIADSYEHASVFKMSGGVFRLRAAIKGQGSVTQRVDLMRRLLFEDRIYVSAAKCPKTIEMFDSLKKGKRAIIDRSSEHKHIFDAITYYIAMECWNEMALGGVVNPNVQSKKPGLLVTRL